MKFMRSHEAQLSASCERMNFTDESHHKQAFAVRSDLFSIASSVQGPFMILIFLFYCLSFR